MARPPRPDQFSALVHIRECIAEHGDETGPRIARAKFPAIDKATWSRWCKQVREEEGALRSAHPTVIPTVCATALSDAEVEVLPGVIDFFKQIGAMMAACDALQEYAWPRDPVTGARRLRNPLMLERAIRLRATVLDLAHRREEVVWSVERFRDFQLRLSAAITGALSGDQPEADKRASIKILEAVRAMEAKHKADGGYVGSKSMGIKRT